MTRSRSILTAATLGGALTAYRHWHQHWGATQDEITADMPGDEVIARPSFCATRAITIDAPSSCVWPWIVQMGFNRAGFYSYDLLDNLGRPSSWTILPEYQHVEVGQVVAPMANPPTEQAAFRVREFEEFSSIVWEKSDSTWAWQLTTVSPHVTRLVTRLRLKYDPRSLNGLVSIPMMEIGDFPMMRKQLLGIKARAESLWRRDGRVAEPVASVDPCLGC